jgi:hypothetical protein
MIMGKYSALLRRATNSVDYWTQVSIRAFVRDLIDRMDAKDISQAVLAERIGTSPAYVSKVMRGNANFTLETMTKLAMAVDGKIKVCIVDGSPMAKTLDTDAPNWGVCVFTAKRVASSNVVALNVAGVVSAANAWEFGSASTTADVVGFQEVRAA